MVGICYLKYVQTWSIHMKVNLLSEHQDSGIVLLCEYLFIEFYGYSAECFSYNKYDLDIIT
jgi:hypothetical protein